MGVLGCHKLTGAKAVRPRLAQHVVDAALDEVERLGHG